MTLKPIEIWTIGHSTRSGEEFIALLQRSQIEALVDVRRFPGSRRHPQFGSAQLSSELGKSGIEYFHLPDLGGRRRPRPDSPNTAWRNEAFRGYADYMMTEPFRTAVEQLLQIARSKRAAMMCAEAVWWQCHRGLIADHLKADGHTVWHIMGQDRVEPHPFTSAARIVNDRLSYAEAEQELELPLHQNTKPAA
jgi:uncharacterized protein (DUF488 family)